MGRLLFLVFLLVPVIEIALFIMLGQSIGLWPTLLGVLVTALIGSALIRRQGLALIGRLRTEIGRGAMPAREMADGVMLAVSGALLLTPGYFTDTLGFVLLIPAVRHLIYTELGKRFSLVSVHTTRQSWTRSSPQERGTIDLDPKDWHEEP